MDRRAYFVSRIDSIAEIEMRLMEAGLPNQDARHEAVSIVASMLNTAQERILSLNKELDQLRTFAAADQRYLTQQVPLLREAEREKYKKFDISYKPADAIPAVKQVKEVVERKSREERAIEKAAAVSGISVEEYKRLQAESLAKILGKRAANTSPDAAKLLGEKCTCSETPGLCKLHPVPSSKA